MVHAGMKIEGNAALHNRVTEQPTSQRRQQEASDIFAARGLTEEGDVGRISTKLRDVAMHPLQGDDLVEQTVVSGSLMRRFRRQRRVRKPCQNPQAIVNGHDHYAQGSQGLGAVIPAAVGSTAAVNP